MKHKNSHGKRKFQNDNLGSKYQFNPEKPEFWGIALARIKSDFQVDQCESFVRYSHVSFDEVDEPVVFNTPEPKMSDVEDVIQNFANQLREEVRANNPFKATEVINSDKPQLQTFTASMISGKMRKMNSTTNAKRSLKYFENIFHLQYSHLR